MSDGDRSPQGQDRQWSELNTVGSRSSWTLEPDGPLVQGPHSLAEYRGQRLLLYLEPFQYGLLVVDDELRALFLDGAHHLEIGDGENQVPHQGSLTLLDGHRDIDFRFSGSDALHAPDGTGVIARGSLTLDRPARFYQSILRQAGREWSSDSLLAVLTPVLRRAFQEILGRFAGAHPGTLQSALMALEPGCLDEFLEAEGLQCTSLAAYTDTPPVEDCPDPASLLSDEFLHT